MTNSFEEGQDVSSRRGDVLAMTRAMASGDEEGFRRFHEEYFDRVFRYVLVLVRGDVDAARDAAQETYLRIVRHAKPFRDEDTFWRWLTVLAKSAVRDGMRRRRSYTNLLSRFVAELGWSQNGGALDGSEKIFREGLETAMNELPEGERRLIESKYFEGASVREIAGRDGSTERSVESRLLRTRRKLREMIERSLRHEE